ncbi:MAG: hypothetical protein MZV65_00175 [Chromatiales bacterium]|nr:hypothetical protein [Chromatiales bacterium]
MFQHDLKGLLAYSTDQPPRPDHPAVRPRTRRWPRWPAVFHIINHATFKASLFMAAGIIDHECGTRDMRRINGLWQLHAVHRGAGDRRRGRHGRRAAAQRLPVQGDVLRRERCASAGTRLLDSLTPLAATLAGVFARGLLACASSTTCSSTASRATCRARRTSRRAGCGCRSRCWCCSAWLVGICPGADGRPAAGAGAPARCSAGRCRNTAWRSGTASTGRWLMSLVATRAAAWRFYFALQTLYAAARPRCQRRSRRQGRLRRCDRRRARSPARTG